MANEETKPTKEMPEQKKEQFVPPPIPSTSWFETEHHVIAKLDEDAITLDGYSRLWHFGHRDYMTNKQAIALATEILKQLAPEKLATKGR